MNTPPPATTGGLPNTPARGTWQTEPQFHTPPPLGPSEITMGGNHVRDTYIRLRSALNQFQFRRILLAMATLHFPEDHPGWQPERWMLLLDMSFFVSGRRPSLKNVIERALNPYWVHPAEAPGLDPMYDVIRPEDYARAIDLMEATEAHFDKVHINERGAFFQVNMTTVTTMKEFLRIGITPFPLQDNPSDVEARYAKWRKQRTGHYDVLLAHLGALASHIEHMYRRHFYRAQTVHLAEVGGLPEPHRHEWPLLSVFFPMLVLAYRGELSERARAERVRLMELADADATFSGSESFTSSDEEEPTARKSRRPRRSVSSAELKHQRILARMRAGATTTCACGDATAELGNCSTCEACMCAKCFAKHVV